MTRIHRPHRHRKKPPPAVERPIVPQMCKLTLRHGEMAILATRDIEITLRFAGRYYPRLRFKQAAEFVRAALRYDREAYQHFVLVINEDHWITGFWSDVLKSAEPPDDWEWVKPERQLHVAEQALYRDDVRTALVYFNGAVNAYNDVHKKLHDYLEGVRKGAERAITLIEIMETALVATLEGPAAWSLVQRAGFAAAFKAEEGLLAQYFSGEFKWSDVGKDILFEFASSLCGGALSKAFTNEVRKRLARQVMLKEIGQTGAPEFLQESLRQMIPNAIKAGYLPATVRHWESDYLAHSAQILVLLVGSAIVALARKKDGEEMSVWEFVSQLLDDLGNDRMQIIGKLMKLR